MAGGRDNTTSYATCEIYDPAAPGWTATGAMTGAGSEIDVVPLPSGKFLAFAGVAGAGSPAVAQVYDPGAGTWAATGAMVTPRRASVLVIVNGLPLAIGGETGAASLATTELYDPAANTWTAGPALTNTRTWLTAIALDNGLVLAASGRRGLTGGLSLNSAELLTSATATIVATGVTAPDATHVNGTLSLAAAATGYWDVVVRQSGSRVGRLSGGFSVSTAAPAAPTAPSGFAGTAQSTFSILWSWTDNSSTETGFQIKAGAANVSGNLAANTTIWLQTGLGVNTSSGALFAQAFNSTGTSNSGSLTRFSLAAVPTGLAASGVTASSATLTWAGAGTTYQLERSTGMGFSLLSTGAAGSYGDTALSAATTYYYRVLALNGDAIATAYASSITVVTSPGAAAPNAPSGFAGTAQSTSSVLWSWADNSTTETGFRIMSGATNVSGNLAANTTIWLQTGLGVNTSSGALFAQAFNSTGTSSSGSLTRFSLAAAPTGLAASGVSASSATLTWTGAGTSYQLERSTGASFATIYSSASASYGDTGLAAAATYYYRVLALNGDSVATACASSITVVTLPGAAVPNAPSGFAGTAQSTSSVLWSWIDNSSNETGFRIMAGAANVSGDLAANTTIWLQTGLGVNTSSGALFAQAFNSTGTSNSGPLTRSSLAAAPTGLAATSITMSSATLTWSGAGTSYQLERSTTGGAYTTVYSSASPSYIDVALSAGTTYFYRVLAFNGDYVATAYSSTTFVTLPGVVAPSAPSGFAGTAQSTSSILWSWTPGSVNEGGFRVLSGASNLSGDLAAGTTLWLQAGLGIGASTGPLSAQAFNSSGTANSGTASRFTLAAVSGTPSASGVNQTSATISWSASGNPGGLVYSLERSTGTGFGLQFTGAATSYFDSSLTPAATHFYRVRTQNGDAIATAYSSTAAIVALPPPPAPGAAGTPAGTALGTSSASWTWVLASGATNHYMFRASDNAYLGSSSTGPFVLTALSPNLPYGLRAAGVNVGGTGPLSPSGTVYTLAAVPTGAAASSITATSLLVTWGLNGNPASTSALLQRSTDAVAYATMTAGAVAFFTDVDLLGCTTYYYRVRNVNGDGLATAYASFQGVTANTTPAPPAGLTASANAGGTISLSWGLSPIEGVTGYRLYTDGGSGTVSFAAPLAVLGSTATSFTTGVLTSSAAYTFALRTAHRCGVVETTGALATSGAATAAAVLRAALKEPDSGKRIHGNRVTILGELTSGAPGDTQQILFQYKLAASTAWLTVPAANVNNPNPDFDFPYFTHWDVNALAAGSYDLRAVAYDRSGVPDAAPPSVRIVVDAVAPDIDENDVAGKVKKDQTISNGVTSVVDTAGQGASDPSVRVTIPAGAVNAATATVSVIANPTITTAAPSGQTLVGSAIKIDLSNGQSALNGTAAISLTYPSTVLFPALLQIFYLNEATGQWSRDFASTVDPASHTVTGLTPHFSTFALMLGTAFSADLDSVQVYPVPFKPNGVNADEGRPFSTGDPASGIIFANLAMGSQIKIYTLTGRLVSSLDNASIAGTVRWDARNQDGRDVASGAYFAVVSSAGHKSVVKKLVIIR